MEKEEQLCLSDEELLSEIKYYVENKFYNYAVMIDGAWGSGKTHFVKQVLLPELRKETKTSIYISLYGVRNIGELSKKIYIEFLLKDKTDRINTTLLAGATEALDVVSGLISPFIGKYGDIEIKEKKIQNLVQKIIPIKDCILIFDDLERCNCPMKEILGYINGFVEQAGMKVLIIANQAELRQKVDEQSMALQLNTVLGEDEKLDFEDKHEKEIYNLLAGKNTQEEGTKKVSIEEARKRVSQVFKQPSEYERIREKIIGSIYYYRPNMKKVMRQLIENNFSYGEIGRSQLEKNLNYLADYMEKEQHVNFRTFQFFLLKMNGLFSEIKAETYENQDMVYKKLIQACWYACIMFKKGNLDDIWKENQEYNNTGELRIRFIEEYVQYSILDQGIKKLLKKFDDEETEKIRNQKDPINSLQYDWIVSTEKVVREWMDDIIKNACAGKYGIGSYDRIQQIFLQIYQAGFESTYIKRLTDAMCASIQDGTANGELDCLLSMNGEEKEIVELYNANMQRIVRTYNKCMAEKSEGDMNSFLQESDWAKQIYDYIWQAKHPRESEDYRKKIEVFLNGMDINVLTSKLKEASLENLEKFRRTLREIYSQNYVPDILWNEKEQIIFLLEKLRKFQEDSTDKIRKYQYKLMADYLSEALDRTKNLQ